MIILADSVPYQIHRGVITYTSEAIDVKAPLIDSLSSIDSSSLEYIPALLNIRCREDFLKAAVPFAPPLIGRSPFISEAMCKHLLSKKKGAALGVKFVPGDEITNMEGVMHTFVTPICSILMTGDYKWLGYLDGAPFSNGYFRKVILSAAVQPDFEYENVMMALVQLESEPLIGEDYSLSTIPSAAEKEDPHFLAGYEKKLKIHLIHHLCAEQRLPGADAAGGMEIEETITFLENLPDPLELKNRFLKVGNKLLSLEMLCNTYIHQLRNEFTLLDHQLTQGYVYTIDPPSIFASALGSAQILNRLQAVAFAAIKKEEIFSHMKVLAFNDYADPEMISHYEKIFPEAVVTSKQNLFEKREGTYIGPRGYALVLHNNSDGFGNNIKTEGPTSLDGVIGTFSNAASAIKLEQYTK